MLLKTRLDHDLEWVYEKREEFSEDLLLAALQEFKKERGERPKELRGSLHAFEDYIGEMRQKHPERVTLEVISSIPVPMEPLAFYHEGFPIATKLDFDLPGRCWVLS